MSSDKHQILEPITAVSRLITLVFKKNNTKIAIREHNIVLCEPNTDAYYGIKFAQGLDRYWNGDSREDIYILNHVICNFIEWYILPYKKKEIKIYNGLINMAKFLCVALKKLQKTYKTGTVVLSLQYYINVLTSVIEDRFYPELLYIITRRNRKSFLDEYRLDSLDEEEPLLYSTIFDIDKFRVFWNKDELQSLCEQFNRCFRLPNEKDMTLFSDKDNDNDNVKNNINNDTINEISEKDNEFDNESASYNKQISKAFILPIPRNKKNAIVSGHLVGIANILDTMDKRFRTMLNQSVKGTTT